ncbi:hypothetical protein LOC71_05820 [Rhodopirellula sp. JC740]|uniref:Uncharacterized protein n=1 Tax=Rhodopirellula halodulae TaxID=2894198 RepID=A0ABS8NEC7_9BACT|nr:hypothetical protein [Rhodopirellula sp. JC740]MCC9641784.1 hypothetical protein [Rhodopirellula sp. JC740]
MAPLPDPVQLSADDSMSHHSDTMVGLSDYWSGTNPWSGAAQVPHVVIQAPQQTPRARARSGPFVPETTMHETISSHPVSDPSANGTTYQQNPTGQPNHTIHSHLHHAGQKAAQAVRPLTHPPGVENDPSARGPGRLGVGEHWVKNPQARPSIPNATIYPQWKTPYSYGYFGAEGKRHWSRQHGYRDRSLQWTLR